MSATWIREEEMAELDKQLVDAEYGVSELLRRAVGRLTRGDTRLDDVVRGLEEASSPLLAYPCKVYVEMARDVLDAVRRGSMEAEKALEILTALEREWRSC